MRKEVNIKHVEELDPEILDLYIESGEEYLFRKLTTTPWGTTTRFEGVACDSDGRQMPAVVIVYDFPTINGMVGVATIDTR